MQSGPGYIIKGISVEERVERFSHQAKEVPPVLKYSSPLEVKVGEKSRQYPLF